MHFAKVLLIALFVVAVSGHHFDHARRQYIRELPKRTGANKDLGDVEFDPKPLPCQCVINRTIKGEAEGEVSYEYDTFAVHGSLYKSIINVPGYAYEEVVLRPDVRIADPGSDKVYTAFYHCLDMFYPPCDNELYEEQALLDYIPSDLSWWYNNWTFINVTTGMFQGIACNMYYDYDASQEADIYFYASKDNQILGVEVFTPDYNETFYLSYTFEALQSLFVIDKGTFNDINDTRAYNRPKIEPCGGSSSSPAPSSSHPGSSTHPSSFAVGSGAAFVLVLIAAMSTVLFLF